MHFVPKTYLKRFAVEEMKAGTPQYFVFAIGKELKKPIERRNISRICYERSLYEMPGSTPEEQLLIENMYRDLYEKGYNTLYSLMTDPQRTTITSEERYRIVAFAVSLFYRNTIWNHTFNAFMDEVLKKVHYLAQKDHQQSFFFGDEEVSIAGKTLDELQKENRDNDRPLIAGVNAQAIFALTRLRYKSDFISIMQASPGNEYVTSDNPVVCKSKVKGHFIPMDPENSLWVPIDKDHILMIEPWADQLDWKMIVRLDEPIAGIMTSMNNHYQISQCTEYLIGTQAGIDAIRKNRYGVMEHAMKRELKI